MCTVCYLWFIACSLLMTNANILNDLQEAQKFVEQLDYDYSVAAAADAAAATPQRSAVDLLWYDYGSGDDSSNGGNVHYYGGGGSPDTGTAAATMLMTGDKRGGATQSSTGGIWFGPRLGRRKRRGGSAYNGRGVVLPVDGNVVGPAASQGTAVQAMAAATTAAEQAVVSDVINNVPWVLVPIVENSLYNQLQIKQNSRNGRSSAEDGDDAPSSSRHTARSPPYSPPFSPRLGRQVTMARPQVPRLGREALLYRRDARSALYQQNALLRGRQQRQQQRSTQATVATEPAAAAAAAQNHAV